MHTFAAIKHLPSQQRLGANSVASPIGWCSMKRIVGTAEVAAEPKKSAVGGPVFHGLAEESLLIAKEYPFRINTYEKPPDYDVSIEQFEEYAHARLQRTAVTDRCWNFSTKGR